MNDDDRQYDGRGRARLGQGGPGFAASPEGPMGPVGRLIAAAAWLVLVLAAFAFSLVLFAGVVVVGLLIGGWLWWKTRDLRRQLRERPPGERVIDGEVIRD